MVDDIIYDIFAKLGYSVPTRCEALLRTLLQNKMKKV